jgi:multidrug transporter EmrE-like cation transporter
MFPLLLTIICSTVIVLILKYSHIREGNPVMLLCGNYFTASLISLILVFSEKDFAYSTETFFFGAVLGLLFFLGFFTFAKAVAAAGASLSAVSSRLSVIIPISLSVIIFGEIPTYYQLSGIIAALITIFLFYFSVKKFSSGSFHNRDYYYLFALLILIGINDFCFKIFQGWRPLAEKDMFILTIFSFAFLYSLAYIVLKNIKTDSKTLAAGAVLGVPNVFSSYFLLGALNQLPAIIVYPSINIGIILLTTLAAFLIWKEELNLYGRWAIGLGITAILLLGI